MIQSKCSVPFTPIEVSQGLSGWLSTKEEGGAGWARGSGLHVSCSCFLWQFHYENTRAQFFVEDSSTASALKAVNYKILDQENRRVCIKKRPGLPGGGDLCLGHWVLVLGREFL